MTVSIIISSYNQSAFLAEAIDSARTQSWRNCEVIAIDDGSKDGTAHVIAQFRDVRVVRLANRGPAAARNAGLQIARGDVVIFLDAGDRLWPDAARCAVARLQSRPDVALVVGRCQLIDAYGLPVPRMLPPVRSRFFEQLLVDNYIWTPGMVAFRRAVFELVGGFDESLGTAADYDMYLRVTRQFPVASHGAITVDYRQHTNTAPPDPVPMLEATLAALGAQRSFSLSADEQAAIYRHAMIWWQRCYGRRPVDRLRRAVRERDAGTALAAGWDLLRLYPAGLRRKVRRKLRTMMRPEARPALAAEGQRPDTQPQDAARP